MILQVVIGLAMIITGMGYDLLIWGIVTGIIAEIIMKVTKYKKGLHVYLLMLYLAFVLLVTMFIGLVQVMNG